MMYLLRAFSLPKWSSNLDKTLNQDDNYSENISIRCDCCKFLNSFSFNF